MNIFIFIVLMHWFADFIMQDEEWALGKSKSLKPLFMHTFTYSAIWIIPLILWGFDIRSVTLFFFITFICHTITDFFTSKWVSHKFKKQEYGSSIPNTGAFTIIGFDQVLHYLQLIGTWYLLF